MNTVLVAATMRLLKPIVKILLKNGVTWKAFSELAKKVYVDVASTDYALDYKKLSATRISMLTGIQRKDIQKIKERSSEEDAETLNKNNMATKIIGAWLRDSEYVDENGEPKSLPIEEGEISFLALVKKYGADLTYRSVLDEFVRLKIVEVNSVKAEVKLLVKGYVPLEGIDEKFVMLGTDVGDLIRTFDHNTSNKPEDSYLQLKVCYDNLPESILEELRSSSKKEGFALLKKFDEFLSQHDRGDKKVENGSKRMRAGVGIYYFENQVEEES